MGYLVASSIKIILVNGSTSENRSAAEQVIFIKV